MVSQLMEVIKIGLQKKIKATWVKQGGTLDRLYAYRYRKSPRKFIVVEPFRLKRTEQFFSQHTLRIRWPGQVETLELHATFDGANNPKKGQKRVLSSSFQDLSLRGRGKAFWVVSRVAFMLVWLLIKSMSISWFSPEALLMSPCSSCFKPQLRSLQREAACIAPCVEAVFKANWQPFKEQKSSKQN